MTRGEDIRKYDTSPEEFGFKKTKPEALLGCDPQRSVDVARKILSGERDPGRDIVLLNSAAVIYVGGKADGIKEGVELANESIDSGKAIRKLEDFVAMTKVF